MTPVSVNTREPGEAIRHLLGLEPGPLQTRQLQAGVGLSEWEVGLLGRGQALA